MNGVRFDLMIDELIIKSVYEEKPLIVIYRKNRNVQINKNTLLPEVEVELVETGLEMLNLFDGVVPKEVAE